MDPSKTQHSLFVLVGEPSGDLHGSHLVAELKKKHPHNLTITGVAGPNMRQKGISGPLVMEDFLVMGFTDVLKALPKLIRQFRLLRDHIIRTQPDGVIFIDYPGFNLRMAKALRKEGYRGKLIHYVSPSVWAWGKKRADTMAKTLDLLLTIFPFEATYFSHTSLPVEYVGNPLCNYIDAYKYDGEWKEHVGIKGEAVERIIGVFPGSRVEEITRNLPVILQTAQKFLENHPKAVFAVSCATESIEKVIRKMLQEMAPQVLESFVFVPKKWAYELMKESKCAIAKSGTVTLELALHGIPTVVVYKLSHLNKWVAQYVLRLNMPYYCIVNILGDSEIFPELIAKEATEKSLTEILENLYSNNILRKQRIQACHILRKKLGDHDANAEAAEAIAKTLQIGNT